MNRIQFIKRLLASIFGAAIVKQSKATVIPTEAACPELVEREESIPNLRYLLSATVAGTPYYDFPTAGKQLLTLNEPEEDLYPDPTVDYSPTAPHPNPNHALYAPRLRRFDEHPAILKLEPDNEFDFRAIEVYWRQYKMGYIPRAQNKVLYNLLKDGATLEAKIRVEYDQPVPHLHFNYNYLTQKGGKYPYKLKDGFSLRIRVYLQESTV